MHTISSKTACIIAQMQACGWMNDDRKAWLSGLYQHDDCSWFVKVLVVSEGKSCLAKTGLM